MSNVFNTQRSAATSKTGPLPRFSNLAIHVCSALYGYRDPRVQHMVRRNEELKLRSSGFLPA